MNELELIHRYVNEELARARGRDRVSVEDDLVELGLLDSIGMVRFVRFLEESFAIEIDDEHLVPENFTTIATVASLVARCRGDHDAGEAAPRVA